MTLDFEESPPGEFACSAVDVPWDVEVDELDWDVDIELDLEGLHADGEQAFHA